jgi:hypothetical protein
VGSREAKASISYALILELITTVHSSLRCPSIPRLLFFYRKHSEGHPTVKILLKPIKKKRGKIKTYGKTKRKIKKNL